MASDLTTYLGNKLCRWLGGTAMPSAPAALYLGLFNGDPKGAGSEVTNTIRALGRITVTLDVPASGVDNTMPTTADADFGPADAGATVTHVAVFDDDGSGANMLATKAVGSNVITAGQGVKFLAGDLTFTIGS